MVPNKEILLRQSEQGIVLRTVTSKTEKVQNELNHYYDLDQAKTLARTLGISQLDGMGYNLRNLIVDFVQELLQPNITLNRNETEERKKAAVAEIKPVLYKIKAGEMIVREGERISEFQLLKLITLQAQAEKEQVVAVGLGAALVLLTLLVVVYLLCVQSQPSFMPRPNKNLLLMACTLVTFFLLAQVSVSLTDLLHRNVSQALPPSALSFGIPLASGAMIICLFFDIQLAIAFAIVIAAGSAIIFHNRFEIFIYFFLNSAMAAYWIRDCRERRVFIAAGVKVGGLNVILATALNLYLVDFSGAKLLWDGSFAFLGGVAAGIVTAGIVPLVEIAFDYATDIKLLELANLDRPILRRLMIEAPGTYHHSVIVGSLVEAAAADIGANPLLARVCGYYHDIGKIDKPLYFIENQSNGKNRHDKLAPSMSSLILINHIKNGVDIASENKLGQTIIDTIRQHHGTSLIKYFYTKAVQLRGEDAVDIAAFRYPGPRPQSREAGLVMLADVVEAASRSLENPTPSRIRGLVQNLINDIFSDGQLDNCDLTLKDLHSIAKSFNTILNGIHHHRIEYPEKAVVTNAKGRNGSTDHQQSRQSQTAPGKGSTKSAGHLKRLGQQ